MMMHPAPMLSEPEIAERLPIWTVLSELFLDTELLERDIQRIAADLRQSAYGRDALEAILREEVAPAFAPNLRSVAGEWTPWSLEEVRAIMEAWMVRRPATGWRALLGRRFSRRNIPEEWRRIAAFLS